MKINLALLADSNMHRESYKAKDRCMVESKVESQIIIRKAMEICGCLGVITEIFLRATAIFSLL